ncbi:hypothetical protein M0P48_00865 [Candidatus Gracilibacteria bacterium]|jgi:hypothetical protein|nr:hypothetical protein [Candidatus Gracilibacteria bacterium]
MDELNPQNPAQPIAEVPLATTPAPEAQTKPAEAQAPVATTPAPTTPVTPVATAEEPQNAFLQMIMENKKIVIIGVIAVIAVIIGLSVLIGAKSSNEYQGLIKLIDEETQELKEPSIPLPDTTATVSEEVVPATSEELTPAKVAR